MDHQHKHTLLDLPFDAWITVFDYVMPHMQHDLLTALLCLSSTFQRHFREYLAIGANNLVSQLTFVVNCRNKQSTSLSQTVATAAKKLLSQLLSSDNSTSAILRQHAQKILLQIDPLLARQTIGVAFDPVALSKKFPNVRSLHILDVPGSTNAPYLAPKLTKQPNGQYVFERLEELYLENQEFTGIEKARHAYGAQYQLFFSSLPPLRSFCVKSIEWHPYSFQFPNISKLQKLKLVDSAGVQNVIAGIALCPTTSLVEIELLFVQFKEEMLKSIIEKSVGSLERIIIRSGIDSDALISTILRCSKLRELDLSIAKHSALDCKSLCQMEFLRKLRITSCCAPANLYGWSFMDSELAALPTDILCSLLDIARAKQGKPLEILEITCENRSEQIDVVSHLVAVLESETCALKHLRLSSVGYPSFFTTSGAEILALGNALSIKPSIPHLDLDLPNTTQHTLLGADNLTHFTATAVHKWRTSPLVEQDALVSLRQIARTESSLKCLRITNSELVDPALAKCLCECVCASTALRCLVLKDVIFKSSILLFYFFAALSNSQIVELHVVNTSVSLAPKEIEYEELGVLSALCKHLSAFSSLSKLVVSVRQEEIYFLARKLIGLASFGKKQPVPLQLLQVCSDHRQGYDVRERVRKEFLLLIEKCTIPGLQNISLLGYHSCDSSISNSINEALERRARQGRAAIHVNVEYALD